MTESKRDTATDSQASWDPPVLKMVGTISELVKAGEGKISTSTFDTGDTPFKPKGQG
jgi:hypothetical protein